MSNTDITTIEELRDLSTGDHLTVVVAGSSFCGPCNNVHTQSMIQKIEDAHQEAKFLKLQVDNSDSELIKLLEIETLPAYVLCKNKEEIDRLDILSPTLLARKVSKHLQKEFKSLW